jgi:elongation factor Ts
MSAALVKELRERTGLGLLECKKALAEADGDIDAAIEALRKSSGMKAAKKAGRTAADGVVAIQTAEDGSFGTMVEVNSETDFVARDENFLGFVQSVVHKAFDQKISDVESLAADETEAARQALVQKNRRKHKCSPSRDSHRRWRRRSWLCAWQQSHSRTRLSQRGI